MRIYTATHERNNTRRGGKRRSKTGKSDRQDFPGKNNSRRGGKLPWSRIMGKLSAGRIPAWSTGNAHTCTALTHFYCHVVYSDAVNACVYVHLMHRPKTPICTKFRGGQPPTEWLRNGVVFGNFAKPPLT